MKDKPKEILDDIVNIDVGLCQIEKVKNAKNVLDRLINFNKDNCITGDLEDLLILKDFVDPIVKRAEYILEEQKIYSKLY